MQTWEILSPCMHERAIASNGVSVVSLILYENGGVHLRSFWTQSIALPEQAHFGYLRIDSALQEIGQPIVVYAYFTH